MKTCLDDIMAIYHTLVILFQYLQVLGKKDSSFGLQEGQKFLPRAPSGERGTQTKNIVFKNKIYRYHRQ